MKKIEPKSLPGFMELNPDDQIIFNNIKKIIEDSYIKYGFWPLDTPLIEYSDVLLAKAGGETEMQIYRFTKGDTDLSLRFDLTVPLAKYVAARSRELSFPFKRYQIGKVYRGERPQRGRFREFYQCDIDVIGDESLSLKYDAEIPSIICDVFTKLNFGKFKIRINNRKVLNGFFDSLNIGDYYSEILRIIDKIDKIGYETTERYLQEILNDKKLVKKIMDFINIKGTNKEKIATLKKLKIDNELFKLGVNELDDVVNNILMMGVSEEIFDIDLTIVRGLDYYTGTVYETILVDYPQIGSVCSGGRYDDLATYYTDRKLPGVGISIGLTRLFYQLKEAGLIGKNNNSCADVIILPVDIENYNLIYAAAKILRNNNYSVSIDYTDSKFKNKMKYADKIHAKYAILVGEDEVKGKYLTVKNMVTREQSQVKVEDLIASLEK